MILTQSYIRHLPSVIGELGEKASITPILRNPERYLARLQIAGFTAAIEPGETVVPDSKLGPRARFNAKGRDIIHRDQPKERCTRMHYWTYKQRHGDKEVEVEDSTQIFYYRYPRTFVSPPSQRLSIAVTRDGEKILVGPTVAVADAAELIHSINLVLQVAKQCELLDAAGELVLRSAEKRLDWEVLPAGRQPWARMEPLFDPSVRRERGGNQPRIWARLKTIESYSPDFRARGHAGYAGYLIFGFKQLGLYVCESTQTDNATYVFNENWEAFAQLTKAEVIAGALATQRIVHLSGWRDKIDELLSR